jgi:hypothetical protein
VSNEKVVGIRLSNDDFKRVEALAKSDDRKVGTYLKRQILRQLPILEAEQKQIQLNEPPAAYRVAPKKKTVVPKKLRN